MINRELINYLHSVYPELPIDISYIKGYLDDEINKIERLGMSTLFHTTKLRGNCLLNAIGVK